MQRCALSSTLTLAASLPFALIPGAQAAEDNSVLLAQLERRFQQEMLPGLGRLGEQGLDVLR